MTTEPPEPTRRRYRGAATPASGGAGLFLLMCFVGALVYFWTRADTVGQHLLAILKAAVWPAYVTYGALRLLFH